MISNGSVPRVDARLLLVVVPLIFAVPVLYGLAASLVDTIGTGHPYFGDVSGTSADARAFAFGVPLYQDPNVGYTPLTYTPLMSVVAGLLDLVRDWDGWPVVITLIADTALVTLAAVLAFRPAAGDRRSRLASLTGAVGLGAFALWLVAFVPFNSLFAPRTDQLAWALSLWGLVLVPRGATGSPRTAFAAVALLTLGWWTKQPAGVATLAAAVWLGIAAARGAAPRRRCLAMVLGISLVGAVSFGLAALLTGGWSTAFVVEIPMERAHVFSLHRSVSELLSATGPAAAAALAFGLAAILPTRVRDPSLRATGPRWTADFGAICLVLALFVLIDLPTAVWFRQAVGTTQNQFLGIAWALALVAAIAWGLAQARGLRSSAATAGILIFAFVLTELPGARSWLHEELDVIVPAKGERVIVFNQPRALLAYSSDHLVYHPAYPGIGVTQAEDLYPGQDNVVALTWSGRQPGYLVRALLERRFDVVFPFSPPADSTGRWEANYIWKLNQVIRAKYEPSGALPPQLVASRIAALPFQPFVSDGPRVPRPGPDPAAWMNNCFGPFEIGGTSWRIAAGGGFWCRPGGRGGVLSLVATPAPDSEIRADGYRASSHGEIRVAATRPGTVEVEIGDRRVRRVLLPGRPVTIPVSAGSRGISVIATAGSHARVDLSGLAS